MFVGPTADVAFEGRRYSMPPDAANVPGTSFGYEDRIRFVAGRHEAEHPRGQSGDAPIASAHAGPTTLRLTTIGSLLSPDFVTEGHSVIFVGKTGRGKTHLAIALAYRAMQHGFDALFVNCAELIDELSFASRAGGLREALARYIKPHVLVVDEVGYLAYGDDAANVLFHVVNERHIKRKSMVSRRRPAAVPILPGGGGSWGVAA